MDFHGSGWLADLKRESEANAARRLALVPAPWCDVCEEPVPAVTPSRFHGADVRLCAACLVSELEIVAYAARGKETQ
jgi:hypothetical protein